MDTYQDIAAFYDAEHEGFVDDIEFYLRTLEEGPILEVGAGTGRVTAALAQNGFEVWGVEPSPAMLALATKRLQGLESARLIPVSVFDLDIEQEAACAILPLNLLWHFPDLSQQLDALRSVRRSLREEGMLIVDLANPHDMADRGANGLVRQRFRTTDGGVVVTGWSAAWDDAAEQRMDLSFTYDVTDEQGLVRRSTAALSLRYVYRWELELLLCLAGFTTEAVYGSYQRDPYSTVSPGLVVIARATNRPAPPGER